MGSLRSIHHFLFTSWLLRDRTYDCETKTRLTETWFYLGGRRFVAWHPIDLERQVMWNASKLWVPLRTAVIVGNWMLSQSPMLVSWFPGKSFQTMNISATDSLAKTSSNQRYCELQSTQSNAKAMVVTITATTTNMCETGFDTRTKIYRVVGIICTF